MTKKVRKTIVAQVELEPGFDSLRAQLEASLAADRVSEQPAAATETPNSEETVALPSNEIVRVPPSTDTPAPRSRKKAPSADPLAELLAKAAEMASKPKSVKSRKAKEPKVCLCGCQGNTKGGSWLPGHDSRFLSTRIKELRSTQNQAAQQPVTVQ